ncbi:hypothetical protein CEUSTIGMA_g9463.t1 [Chlamydomonas eustigma]|uniref:Uncharacterized protein n=1 Tax=Chlamydomonas eustigma TaxID=1157962 RepID=A0A250XG26_9CHLO|nr:hypothetical protein CEUSTIGMA_g9463.t1 [Chlamydomonas eustigma]|eukprot:GAX82035.1 hypothetical protein CEUSTIGMA_g9463.t1 [Chlamydomonas eustigma]
MPPLVILLVGGEKELPEFKDMVETCKAVGPLKIFSATKAVDAAGQLQKAVQQCGVCHAALLHNNFTLKGKEEFADVIKKLLRDKYPGTVLVSWGNMKKAGTEGKDYHYGLEWSSKAQDAAASIAKVLLMIKNKEIGADFIKKEKGEKDTPRKSLDAAAPAMQRRKSIDSESSPSAAANPTHLRRKSVDGIVPPETRRSSDKKPASPRPSIDAGSSPVGKSFDSYTAGTAPAIRGSFDLGVPSSPLGNPAMQRMSMDSNHFRSPLGLMGGMGHPGSFTGVTAMSNLGPSNGMTGLGSMGGMSPMHGYNGSMSAYSGMSGMAGVGGMGGMTGLMPQPPTMNMSGMMTGMPPLIPMTGMSGMSAASMMPMTSGIGAPPMMSMTPGISSIPSSTTIPMTGAGAVTGLPVSTGTSGMNIGAPLAHASDPSLGVTAQMSTLDVAAVDSSNSELIKALAGEVTRLRQMVEEKRIMEANAGTTSHAAQPAVNV